MPITGGGGEGCGGRLPFLWLLNTLAVLLDPRATAGGRGAGRRAEGKRNVSLPSPVLEWFYLLQASRPL